MRDPDGKPDDVELLSRFARGDAVALDALVARHGRTVYAFVRRFLGPAGGDDVYQEVWLRVIRNASRFRGRSRFSTWLFQVTRSACMDHLRSARRRRERSLDDEDGDEGRGALDRGPGASEAAERNELRSAVEAAVAALPEEQREVLLLRETTELTFGEIAELCGVSPNTVKSRMRYALEHLRQRLKKGAVRPAGGETRGL